MEPINGRDCVLVLYSQKTCKSISRTQIKSKNRWILIGSYIRSWERPGDLPRVIEIVCLFASGNSETSEKKQTFLSRVFLVFTQDKRTNNDLPKTTRKTTDWATRTLQNHRDALRCFGKVSIYWYTSDLCRVILLRHDHHLIWKSC